MKERFKKTAKLLLICLMFSFLSCENQESYSTNQASTQEQKITNAPKITDAEKWFNAYKSKSNTNKSTGGDFHKAFKNIDYYWENASIIPLDDNLTAIAVPIKDTPEDPNYRGQKMLYLYPSDSKYQSVIQEIFPDSEADIDDNQKREGFEDLKSFSGYIITWDLKNGFVKGARFKNDTITEEVKDVRMVFDTDAKAKGNSTGKMTPMFDEGDGVGSERSITTRGGTAAVPLNNVIVVQKSPAPTPKDYSIGGAFGGDSGIKGYLGTPTGGGGSTGTDEGGDLEVVFTPPSCESFNFIPLGSLWQVAMVKNINFRVLGISPRGIQILHVVSYPQAVYFGTPTNVKVGNTNITSGIAANTSARVLQKSMQEVIDKYGGTNVSDLILDRYFRERLAYNYPLFVPGGRVIFNSTENLPATNYKTNTFTAGDCN